MTELVAVDIGGTNARFTIATVRDDGSIDLGEVVTLHTHAYASLRSAWEAFAEKIGRPLPDAGAIAIAAPVDGSVIKLTNSPWVIRPSLIPSVLGLERYTLINDFGAVAYAVSRVQDKDLRHLCGPDEPLGKEGTISVVGPGTGLGVAQLHRQNGRITVVETEGGHIDFAPLDKLEDQILERLRQRYRRVSIERLVSGPGLSNIYEALAAIEGRIVPVGDDKELWKLALSGEDILAAAALDRFCLTLGAVAGDLALAHGAWSGTVIAGGVGARVADHLPISGFAGRYMAKGRFEARMARIPVKLITHEQPGLLGAAAAFAEKHCR
ncbi:MAG: glucokinase [Sphingomonas oligoaromativorans]|jgi:glucokinase|uniref:glucokinase n=1 Tax=Sphingomonas oligoaromativorans TaxID=575322 RepID=UPI001424A54F|nr:glucokinase [Sphingomonas oligoaromativorans]NIJ33972.1 glucokinase [Sphingomonas oligoaromativorans]